MSDADIIILGGGPAGSAAAITAAHAGLRVTLIERQPFPRAAPGESLHPGVQPLLRQLGVEKTVLASRFLRYAGHRVSWGGPEHLQTFGDDAEGPWRGFQAWRPTFDAILLYHAQTLGVQVLQPASPISALIDNGRIVGVQFVSKALHADFVVDATGRWRAVSHWLGLRWRQCGPRRQAWYGYAVGDVPIDDTPLLAADSNGWTWTARVRTDIWAWTRVNFDGSRPASHWRPPALHLLRPYGMNHGADVTWQVAERPAGLGYFLAGDAAAILDPLSSHGVLKALMSGIQAGHLVAAIKCNKVPTEVAVLHYTDWLHKMFDHDVVRLGGFYAQLTS